MERMGKCPHRKSSAGQGFKETKETRDPGENYMDYLKIDELLKLHVRLTDGPIAHDEHLFISIHQNFEVWFQQILFELESIKRLLKEPKVCEKYQQLIFQRLVRVNCIFRIMIQQFEVLETMSCINFMSFREVFQGGASGFQSTQFRLLEQILGIKEKQRTCTFLNSYNEKLTEEQRQEIEDHQDDQDLCTLIDGWLSRTPGLQHFLISYKNAVEGVINDFYLKAKVLEHIDHAKSGIFESKAKQLEKDCASSLTKKNMSECNKIKFLLLARNGGRIHGRKLSYRAFMGALMINCYSSEPRFTVPYEIIKNLMDMDTFLTKFRFGHAMMVKRMIGGRPGTGGSGGYNYLRSTVSDRYMPFIDLFEVATYLIAPQKLPRLASDVLVEISKVYRSDSSDKLDSQLTDSTSVDLNSISADSDSTSADSDIKLNSILIDFNG
ncbi:tryptophan 2,3-dioxygenase B-like [Bolinopsis microptera]|uniref:tryptophan 2,3-dioxygenase B-like n=1 Tax=Bolinopsis microptera TaxID=2820187 RepID=UPI00307B0D27